MFRNETQIVYTSVLCVAIQTKEKPNIRENFHLRTGEEIRKNNCYKIKCST